MNAGSRAVSSVIDLFDLERIEDNLFRGRNPATNRTRVFGGVVIGQSLAAACRTVPDRMPHSLHAYFTLPGDPKVPIVYEVERMRDGRSFTTRLVHAIQHGETIFAMLTSVHGEEEGFEHQIAMPKVPMPEELPNAAELTRLGVSDSVRIFYERDEPLELKPVDLGRFFGKPSADGTFSLWIRFKGTLTDDPILNRCCLAFASDRSLLDATLVRHGANVLDRGLLAASLDHTLWFHRPFRADDWLLYVQDSPSAQDGRALARGSLFSRDGLLVASVAQEGLIRRRAADR